MFETTWHTIRRMLGARWERRLPDTLASAANVAGVSVARLQNLPLGDAERVSVERLLRDAYLTGYRQAYFDGVVDLIESGADVGLVTAPTTESVIH